MLHATKSSGAMSQSALRPRYFCAVTTENCLMSLLFYSCEKSISRKRSLMQANSVVISSITHRYLWSRNLSKLSEKYCVLYLLFERVVWKQASTTLFWLGILSMRSAALLELNLSGVFITRSWLRTSKMFKIETIAKNLKIFSSLQVLTCVYAYRTLSACNGR